MKDFSNTQKVSQSTLVSKLKNTFEMSYKRIKKLNKSNTEKPNCRKFILGWAIQVKLDTQNYELIFIDEFSLSDRWLKFYGWSERGKSEYIKYIPDSFNMSFYVAFSAERIYGIMRVRGTGNLKIFIHFLSKVFKCR